MHYLNITHCIFNTWLLYMKHLLLYNQYIITYYTFHNVYLIHYDLILYIICIIIHILLIITDCIFNTQLLHTLSIKIHIMKLKQSVMVMMRGPALPSFGQLCTLHSNVDCAETPYLCAVCCSADGESSGPLGDLINILIEPHGIRAIVITMAT